MESTLPYGRALQSHLSSSLKQRRSGYEPSDTETEWQDSPWHEPDRKTKDIDRFQGLNVLQDQARSKSPLKQSRRTTGKLENEDVSPQEVAMLSPTQRRRSKSPHAPQRDDVMPDFDDRRNVSPFSRSQHRRNNWNEVKPNSDSHRTLSPFSRSERPRFNKEDVKPDTDSRRTISPFSRSERPRYNRDDVKPDSDSRRNISPFLRTEHRRHISPYKAKKEDHWPDDQAILSSSRKHKQANHYSRRTASAPKTRQKEYESFKHEVDKEQKVADRNLSPLPRSTSGKERDDPYKHNPSGSEINEILANAKISKAPPDFAPSFQSTESIAPGDIFFSKEYATFTMQDSIFSKNGSTDSKFSQKTESYTDRDPDPYQRTKGDHHFNQHARVTSASTVSTRSTTNTSSVVSRQTSNLSDYSGRTNGSTKRFVANRQKNQSEAWFSCIKKGSCRSKKKSPEKERSFYEASVIEKAYVVESLRQFWADKHRPGSLSGFLCHKQEALLLKQLVSSKSFPHILLKGLPGSGKKALAMALLHEIYGPAAWSISHGLRHFHVQETRAMEVAVSISSSPHHTELNVTSEPNAIYALMAMVKQIRTDHAVIPEISNVNMKADYKVIVLYDVDKAADNIQHLIKWIMDGYSDACKLILCCEDDASILEHVKSRCKTIKVEPPVTHEIMEVLIQIARREDFELPMSFAAKIANKSKQNLRRAIMALEACKAHNYPFVEDQPIPIGWEEGLVEIASEIIADASQKRLFFFRGKLQKLLLDFVHPKLILLKLVEQFLKGVEAGSKRELYYWHAYYDKRLPTGTSALLKLEEFTAKIMSIYRRSYNQHKVS